MENKSIARYYHHIDNGGISIDISIDKDNIIKIELDTCYHGYPSVSSVLSGHGIGSKVLREIAGTFNEAANMLSRIESDLL